MTSNREQRWERWAPAGGIGFLAAIAVGAVVLGESPPASQAPAPAIAAYFAENRVGHFLNVALAVLGGFALYPWFLASLHRAIRRAEGEDGILAAVTLVAGVGLLGPLLLQTAGWGAAALEAGPHRDPSVAAALMDLGNMGFLLLPIPAGVLVGVTSLAARRGGFLPRWLALAGLPVAVVLILGGFAWGLAPVLFVLFALWVVSVAIALMRLGGRAR